MDDTDNILIKSLFVLLFVFYGFYQYFQTAFGRTTPHPDSP